MLSALINNVVNHMKDRYGLNFKIPIRTGALIHTDTWYQLCINQGMKC